MLGSTRLVLDQSGAIKAQSDYEPFGEKLMVGGVPYMERTDYIGKETDDESNLGDYSARKYSPKEGGRFTSIDPKWEKYRMWSPYAYSANNPLVFKDPSGEEIWIHYDEQITHEDGSKETVVKRVQYKSGKLLNEDGSAYEGNNAFVAKIAGFINDLYATGNELITHRLGKLENSDLAVGIQERNAGYDVQSFVQADNEDDQFLGIPTGSIIHFDTRSEDQIAKFGHELLAHAYDNLRGTSSMEYLDGLPRNEIHAVNVENLIRIYFNLPSRRHYREPGDIPDSLHWFKGY